MKLLLSGIVVLIILLSTTESTNSQYNETFCQESSECVTSLGEVCHQKYESCQVGMCGCPDGKIRGPDSQCLTELLGDDDCKDEDDVICPPGMHCSAGVCLCEYGEQKLSSDRRHCLNLLARELGEQCEKDEDCETFDGDAYSTSRTECREEICECRAGYKRDEYACVKSNINEPCLLDDNCDGGSICVENLCACPEDYVSIYGGTKCVRADAKLDVDFGKACDPFGGTAYCAEGLECVNCGGIHICDRPDHYSNNPKWIYMGLGILAGLIVIVVLGRCISRRKVQKLNNAI